jgi:calcineurin-like phosphoesterase family protein
MKTWVISDTHFYHEKLVDRPKDFNEQIVRNWSNTVGPDDVVYHLGDIGFCSKENFKNLIRGLPGVKILIRGNHDKFPVGTYLDSGFVAVMDYAVVNVRHTKGIKRPLNTYFRVLLSHMPMEIGMGSSSFGDIDYNVHGHFHDCPPRNWEFSLRMNVSSRHRLFSIEEVGYMPLELPVALKHERLVGTECRMREDI